MRGPRRGTLGIVVIGLGDIGKQHVDVCSRLDCVSLQGVFDVDRERCNRIAQAYGTKAFESLDEALAFDGEEAVVVATPDDRHLAPAQAALLEGKHCLIEKPLATSLDEARELVRLASASPARAMVGHTLRFDERYYSAIAARRDSRLGDLVHVSAKRRNRQGVGTRVGGRTTVSMFLGVHDLDFLMWLADSKVRSVSAVASKIGSPSTSAPQATMALLEFEDGAVGALESSWGLPAEYPTGLEALVEAIFTNGTLRVSVANGEVTTFANGHAACVPPSRLPVYGHSTGALRNEIETFAHCILDDEEFPVSLEDGYNAVAVAAAIDAACGSGASEHVSYVR